MFWKPVEIHGIKLLCSLHIQAYSLNKFETKNAHLQKLCFWQSLFCHKPIQKNNHQTKHLLCLGITGLYRLSCHCCLSNIVRASPHCWMGMLQQKQIAEKQPLQSEPVAQHKDEVWLSNLMHISKERSLCNCFRIHWWIKCPWSK